MEMGFGDSDSKEGRFPDSQEMATPPPRPRCSSDLTSLHVPETFTCQGLLCERSLCMSVACVLCLVAQSCPTLCDPMDCSLPASSIHGDSPSKNTGVSCHALLQGSFPTQGSNPVFCMGKPLGHGELCKWHVPPIKKRSGVSRGCNQLKSILPTKPSTSLAPASLEHLGVGEGDGVCGGFPH